MISEMLLEGFQKHTQRVLRFEPGLNIVVGESDTGKSAIIRALRWLALHEPTSADLIQHGKTAVRVGVLTPNGRVSRFKNTTRNGYKHGDDEFVACANTQPLPVQQAHGLIEENFQAQHDPHFLLSLAPGQLAKEINRIVALDDIDAATRWLRTRGLGISVALTDAETELTNAIAARDEVKQHVDERERIFNILSEYRERFRMTEMRATSIATSLSASDLLIQGITLSTRQVEILEKVIAAKAALDKQQASKTALESILSAWRAVESDVPLIACIEAGEALKLKLQEAAALQQSLAKQNTAEQEIREVFCSIRDTVPRGGTIIQALEARNTKLVNLGVERKRLDLLISTCNNEIEACKQVIAAVPKTICPTCGQEIK
jgi:chromosome segregation ATPase